MASRANEPAKKPEEKPELKDLQKDKMDRPTGRVDVTEGDEETIDEDLKRQK